MCISSPSVPNIPERQPMKLPDAGATSDRAGLLAKRKRGMFASILTSPQGALGTANISGVSGSTLG